MLPAFKDGRFTYLWKTLIDMLPFAKYPTSLLAKLPKKNMGGSSVF